MSRPTLAELKMDEQLDLGFSEFGRDLELIERNTKEVLHFEVHERNALVELSKLSVGVWDFYLDGMRVGDAGGGLQSNTYVYPLIRDDSGDYQIHVTLYGNLSLEVRGRSPHFEVTEIRASESVIKISGTLERTDWVGLSAVGVLRGSDTEFALSLKDNLIEIDLAELLIIPKAVDMFILDLYLARGDERYRVGGFLDDIKHKKRVIECPVVRYDGWRMSPYYTDRPATSVLPADKNGLSVKISRES